MRKRMLCVLWCIALVHCSGALAGRRRHRRQAGIAKRVEWFENERCKVNRVKAGRDVLVAIGMFGLLLAVRAAADDSYHLHEFERIPLTDVYYSEGANAGDLNADGITDVVHGPYWFAGPDFTAKHEIYPVKAQPREAYADSFFSWVYDFDQDGWNDVLAVGFPGTPAYVYENPGQDGWDSHWEKHEVFDWVSNESPHFVNIVGDDRPELVCTRDGYFGYASINGDQPWATWTFHPVSAQVATKRFGHGLGVGDIDGDERPDLLVKNGWFRQPETLAEDSPWEFHSAEFAQAGGAEMYAYDVDGDGDQDVITSLNAHAFGLAWHEQVRDGDQIRFRPHLIMGSKPEDNKYGVVFSELHTVTLADMDGDGLQDIVTGKTFWSHHRQSPMWDAGAVVYWFKLVRRDGEVDWVPHQIDGEAGVGRQVIVTDVNNDQQPDVVVGGMKGAHVLVQHRKAVDEAAWRAKQPAPLVPLAEGLTPQEAARRMSVPDGFRVQLAAGEPDVHQPIGFTIDHRGRLWVAEAHTYPRRAPDGEGRDKITILEDTTGDGRLDSRKVFIDGLNLVSGIEVGFGGVWVGAAPYLMFIPDHDGDDRPDGEPEILLDGFGYQDTHETLNAFIWGPDGWLYGCHGVFTHSRVGKPGTPDADRTPLNAGVWRYHPQRHEFEVFAFGTSNPWGVDFNDTGQAFVTACVIPHLYHMVQGARYQRQGGRHFNPYVFDDIKTIADHAHFVGDIRDHAWWGHEPTVPTDTSRAGGGHAHCGAMIYLGNNWPASYRNRIYFNNVHGNRINCDILEEAGSGYVGHHGQDFLFANDRWFRGINLKYGPDGAVHLIDWYDKNACHRNNPEIWDRSTGRIYKVSYIGGDQQAAGDDGQPAAAKIPRDLTKLDDAALAALLSHPNEWYVRMARRLLQARGSSPALRRQLDGMFAAAGTVPAKLRVLWTLHVTGGIDERRALELLQSPDPLIRAWTIQLQLEDRQASDVLLARLAELAAEEPSPVVRLYLASALQRLPLAARWDIAEALVRHAEDAEDHNLPLLYWYGVEPLVAADTERALRLAAAARIPLIARFVVRRAANDGSMLNGVLAAIRAQPQARPMMLEEILRAFEGRVDIKTPEEWSATYAELVKSDSEAVRERADQIAILLGDKRIFPRMRERLVNRAAPIDKRRQALEILVRGRDDQAAASLHAVLADARLRGAAIRALAALGDRQTPEKILAAYSGLTEAEQRDAIATLVARPASALALLEAVHDGKVRRTDVHAYHVRQLQRFENDDLTARLAEVWGDIRETSGDKKQRINSLKEALTPQRLADADVRHGRQLFTKVCASCHTLFGEGGKVGPDITGSNRANLDYLLENVVDPSAVLGKDYRMTVIATASGRVVSGLVQNESDSAVTLRTINDTVVVAKSEIDDRQLSSQSLMPEQLLDPLQPTEIRDLVAYLGSPTQVGLSGPKARLDGQTGRVPDGLEGEQMKVVGKTAGTVRGQAMGGFTKDRWSAGEQLWWTGAKPGERIELEIPVKEAGRFELQVVFTMARDYGIVQLSLDGERLGPPIDLYNAPDVITTGVLTFGQHDLGQGAHRLGVELVGANPRAQKSYMCGIDFVRLVPVP